MRKWVISAGALAAMTASAFAQDGATGGTRATNHLSVDGILSTLVYGFAGILLATLGFKLFDLLIKADIEKEIFENKNVAAAILSSSFILGVAIIIAAAVL